MNRFDGLFRLRRALVEIYGPLDLDFEHIGNPDSFNLQQTVKWYLNVHRG